MRIQLHGFKLCCWICWAKYWLFSECTLLVLRIFVHFTFPGIFPNCTRQFSAQYTFFREMAMFSSKKLSFNDFFWYFFFVNFCYFHLIILKILIATDPGSRVKLGFTYNSDSLNFYPTKSNSKSILILI